MRLFLTIVLLLAGGGWVALALAAPSYGLAVFSMATAFLSVFFAGVYFGKEEVGP